MSGALAKIAVSNQESDRAPRWRTLLGFAVGAALLGTAAWVVWRDRGTLTQSWHAARAAPSWNVAILLVLPWVSWTLTSLMYWRLMFKGGRARVGLGEMHAVLGAAWLMNYLPARPGMFGRLAYHKLVNQIPLAESIAASIGAVACGVGAVLLLMSVSIAAHLNALNGASVGVALALPAIVLAIVGAGARTREPIARAAWALFARYLDVLSWLARYVLLFSILDRPLTLAEGVAFTALSQAAAMVPLVGNGLGVREWASGLMGPALPSWMRADDALARSLVLSTELLHRGVELLACLPVGLVSGWLVGRRMRRACSPENSPGYGADPAQSVVRGASGEAPGARMETPVKPDP
jgi:hypothetical protein